MKLEQIVVSLELAKKLWKAGVRIESCFVWCKPTESLMSGKVRWNIQPNVTKRYSEARLPTPTASELMEALKKNKFKAKPLCYWLPGVLINDNAWNYTALYFDPECECSEGEQTADTPANALAELLLWVTEQEAA